MVGAAFSILLALASGLLLYGIFNGTTAASISAAEKRMDRLEGRIERLEARGR